MNAPERRALVILPTYNEAESLPGIVAKVLQRDDRFSVLIVDDDSPDGTGTIADDLARKEDRVHVIHNKGKDGLGRAYIRGFGWALEQDFDFVFEMDADGSHDPKHLPEMMAAADEYDVVLGSRYIQGVNVVNWPMSRLLLSYFANMYVRIVTGLKQSDSTTGFKCFRKEVLEAIDLQSVTSTGYAFQIEMNYRATRKGFSIGEVPIVFWERVAGESKMSGAIVREGIWRVWAMRLGSLLGRYK